jgi:glutamate-1-semialdehyde 2,1-aminomutase
MTTLGKIIGGGMPMAAYGGRREIMEVVAPSGSVYQAGTLSGNPIATTAGIETLRILMEEKEKGLYERLEENTKTLAEAARTSLGSQVWVNQVGSLMSVFFTGEEVVDFETATSSDREAYAKYFNYMLDSGIYLAPSQFEAMFISGAHSREEIQKTCKILKTY